MYTCGGRTVASAAIARAAAAGYSALVLTIDTAVAGFRERDVRNGNAALLSMNPLRMLPHLPQILAKPQWLWGFVADGGLMQFPNVVLEGRPMQYADVGRALEQAAVTWDDFAWIRRAWTGAIVVKGIHSVEDAQRAVELGADAIVVSNHGGRQLDGVMPTLRLLPAVVAAVGSRTEVLVDGGIRRGSDIVKALSLGARAVMVGRAYAYGVAAEGRTGAARAIAILQADMMRTMKLMGCASVRDLRAAHVHVPRHW